MRAVIQRVSEASVTVEGRVIGAIGRGVLILLGAGVGDTEAEAKLLAEKSANLRIFADDEGRFNRSLLDIGGAALVVSQFTRRHPSRTSPQFFRRGAAGDCRAAHRNLCE